MIATILLTALQTIPDRTGIPNGSDIKAVGKMQPNTYAAMRDHRTLRLIGDLPPAKRLTFTGTVIVLDFPQRGMTRIMNYKDGKRVVLEKVQSENGVPLLKKLSTLPPTADIRFAGPNEATFDAKLPGDEKKLIGFSGTLIAYPTKPGAKGIAIAVVNGKVRSSAWLKPSGLHK
jgi:hypothetical protein